MRFVPTKTPEQQRRRLQPISYEPLRRDGFQDVEWLGKQYAALKSSRFSVPCSENLDALTERSHVALSPLIELPYTTLLW